MRSTATQTFRKGLESAVGIHHEAPVPQFHSNTLRKQVKPLIRQIEPVPVGNTTGKVALYATCYGNYNSPAIGADFVKVYQHNGIHIDVVPREKCCGMPKLELGDLDAVNALKEANIPVLAALVDAGLRPDRADSLLRPDVQAGAAADVP